MKIAKSKGFNETEKLLISLCHDSFLNLWSYPNPYKEDGKEICDLLVIFDNYVLIFFVKDIDFNKNNDIHVSWARWKKKVIDSQIRTSKGAEKYIKNGRSIYVDSKLKTLLPIEFNPNQCIYHKIIVAHGAKNACINNSDKNVYGSLAITYKDASAQENNIPFLIDLERNMPVHVLDSHNLPIILKELDTIYDFTSYLNAKIEAIKKFSFLTYCGEEDLLANYFSNFDNSSKQHFIGTLDRNISGVMIAEGEWKDFIALDAYKKKKQANTESNLWDKIIQRTSQNALDDRLVGDSSDLWGNSPIQEMAKEPRFFRRLLAEKMIIARNKFPESEEPIVRHMTFIDSFYKDKGYVFLQLKIDKFEEDEDKYRKIRSHMLEVACGVAKNKFNHLNLVVGICIYSPKYTNKNYEDLLLLSDQGWTDEDKQYYNEQNKIFRFFETKDLITSKLSVKNFPD